MGSRAWAGAGFGASGDASANRAPHWAPQASQNSPRERRAFRTALAFAGLRDTWPPRQVLTTVMLGDDMVWLALVLLIVAFQRGWVVAPMLLFALPFVLHVLEVPLLQVGLDLRWLIPNVIEGYSAQLVSLDGLLVLSLHQRRF